MTQQETSPIRGWTVVLAALSINLILGVLYAWSVMGKALVAQWHWSKTDATLPFTVSTAAFALTMIFAGRWQDKIGPRYVAMLGGIILGAGLVLSSFAKTPLAMVITFGVIGGIGIGLGYSATTPPSIKWFPPASKGLITGIVVSGVGLAAVYMSPLTNYLLRTYQHPQHLSRSWASARIVIWLPPGPVPHQPACRLRAGRRGGAKRLPASQARLPRCGATWTGTKCCGPGSSTSSGSCSCCRLRPG